MYLSFVICSIIRTKKRLSGYDKMMEELNYLKNIKRPEIIKTLSDARDLGDLKENAEYHIARDEQAALDMRIGKLEAVITTVNTIVTARDGNEATKWKQLKIEI